MVELDAGMFQTGLRAAAQRLPFLPVRAGLGSDVMVNNPDLCTVTSPYADPGSGVAEERRIQPEAIRAFLAAEAWWKFVVCDAADLAEVLRLAERFALPRGRILLQPEGTRTEDLAERGPWVAEACTRHGFRFSPRLHVLLWGARRGV